MNPLKVMSILLLILLSVCAITVEKAGTTNIKSVGAKSQTFSRELWLQDYEALKKQLESGYANLEWIHQARKLDLKILDEQTKDALNKATSDDEAKRALEKFLSAFSDGHLRLRPPDKSSNGTNENVRVFKTDDIGKKVCGDWGFKNRSNGFFLPFDDIAGFTKVSTGKDVFTTALLALDNGKKIGFIRIPLFGPDGYATHCENVWEEFRKTLKSDCDGACQNEFYVLVNEKLSEALAEQVKSLQKEGATVLVVDLGRNGGGTEWVEACVRILSPKTLKSSPMGFIRHQHWVNTFERRLKVVQEDLDRKDISQQQKQLLNEAKKLLSKLLAEAKTPCDKSSIWSSSQPDTKCSMLNTTPIYTTGVFDYMSPTVLKNLRSAAILFKPSSLKYEESAFKGKLIVLVDNGTASASEHFAALLQDNQAASIVGERTDGSGCGYTSGGLKLNLPNSKLKVQMPDCMRYRRDGSNEVEGIKPDVVLWNKSDNKSKRAENLINLLRQSAK